MTLGVLFFLVILGVEYFLWLNSGWRLVLLLVFVLVELFLFYKYIVVSAFYLFRIRRGIDNKQASLIIGKHFPEVGDKLLNLLDLAQDSHRSELLIASIDQRSQKLRGIPFEQAVDFRENRGYVKYLVIPVIILGAIWFSGNLGSFLGSYDRVVHYNLAYEPPAPFSFDLLTGDLNILETKEFVLNVATIGKVKPEDVYITINGRQYLMLEDGGVFSYSFVPPLVSTDFYFSANGVTSRVYRLNALKAPSIQNFRMELSFPQYLHRANEVLKGTGNATFPEGTTVKWQLQGKNTERVKWITKDTSVAFKNVGENFEFLKNVYSDVDYRITTSNRNVKDYERMDYKFTVIKDAYPSVKVIELRDSLSPNTVYYTGEASDDYGVALVRLICFPVDSLDNKVSIPIGSYKGILERFYYTFPSGLKLDEDREYNYYFEVVDNDAIHGGKVVKSEVFNTKVLNDNELHQKNLEYQESVIGNLDKSLENLKKQGKSLNDINLEQKQKRSLGYRDQQQVKDFLRKQQQQENMMERFSKQLKDNLEKGDTDSEMNRLLKERLERQEKEAKRNAELLKELEKVADKLKKDELTERLENLAKGQQSNERSLEQLLELTKRYYVTEKSSLLSRELKALSGKQEDAAKHSKEESSAKAQEELNGKFDNLSKELEDLGKDNEDLKKPFDFKVDPANVNAIKKDQEDALNELNQEGKQEPSTNKSRNERESTASKKQKAAANKMSRMSDDLGALSSGGGGSNNAEDAKMLRQILDNILAFSFEQEDLYSKLLNFNESMNSNSALIRREQQLKELFGFVDDSLFALSLRRPELSDFVNNRISDVYYNIDKALGSMGDNDMYRGVSYQKYVLDASNDLADFLANILDNMEQSLSKSGSGSGLDFQLPDIIRGQGELRDKLEGMGAAGSGKKKEEGSAGKEEGKQGKGENGKEGGKEGRNENSPSDSEGELQELYNIYKEQDKLRQQLEDQLKNMINTEDKQLAGKLMKLMQDFQDDLLENGITPQNMDRINNIEHQLLKLQGAALKQGQKPERESRTNEDTFQNPIITKPSLLENYHNDLEILNRDALPLRQNYQNRVKHYFQEND